MIKEHRLSGPLARQLLKLEFSEKEKTRMHELAQRNREGKLTKQEADELDNYIHVGDLLAILQSKARKLLKQTPTLRRSS
jgi:hypothetical protein